MVQILFVGAVLPESVFQDYYVGEGSRGPHAVMSVAAQKVQLAMVHGLEAAAGRPIDIVSWLPVGYYPWYSRVYAPTREYSTVSGARLSLTSFINLPLFKQVTQRLSVEACVRWWASRHRASVIVCYSAHTSALLACLAAARQFACKVVLVLPDLPQFMDMTLGRRGIARWAKAADVKLLSRAMHRVDGVISLTDETVTRAHLSQIPHIAIQGIVDEQGATGSGPGASEHSAAVHEGRSVLYAGGVSEEYGVLLLLDAFKHVVGDVRLDICGSGPAVGRVQSDTLVDPRIRYWGALPNQVVSELERASTVLVNPRPSNSEFVSYSFPSKLLEFMMSGRPVISTVLPSIPASYWNYVIPIRDETPDGLAGVLNKALAEDVQELDRIGKATRSFAVDNVGSLAQGRRLWSFMSTVARNEVHGDL